MTLGGWMRAKRIGLALMVCALVARGATAQETLREIEFRGLHGLAEETLRFYLGVEVGSRLDSADLDRRILELWERRLIDDIRIEKEALAPGEARLVVTVVERPILRSVDYQGLKGYSRSDVGERMAKEQIDMREGDPLDRGEIARLAALLEEMYRERGYRFAEVQYTLEEVSPTERRVVYRIDQAEKVRIGAIRFDGNEQIGDWRLRRAMKKTKKTGLFTRMFRKDIYSPATIEEDLQAVRDVYRSAGFKRVVVGEPELSVVQRRSKRRLGIEIPIEEGARWKLGEIRVEGAKIVDERAIHARFKRPSGGWLRSKTIEDGLDAVRDLYRNGGYIMSDVRGELIERDGNVADLLVRITEGEQFRVGRLSFEGNFRTRDKVLRREFRVQEGTILNMGAVKSSLFKINQLSYFKLDEDDPIAFENFDTEKKTVDLVVRGDESDRTELQVGGGWSEAFGFFGSISVRTQNFLGRGESVGVSLQSGRYSDQYDVSYFIPWFLDKPQNIGLQVFDRRVDYTQLLNRQSTQKSRGGVLTYGRTFSFFHNFSVSYSLFDREDQVTVFGADGALVPLRFDISNSSIRPAYLYESRDSRVEPTVGKRILFSVEYAGGPLGGNNDFLRPEAGFSWFRPLTFAPYRTVLGFNIAGGWVEPLRGKALVPLERYFLGGETSIRGFDFRDITVRCTGGEPFPFRDEPCRKDERLIDASGALLGGDKYLQINLEYHLLLGGPFRLIGFFDAANVFGERQSVDLERLRMTAGAELRIFVPVFGRRCASSTRPISTRCRTTTSNPSNSASARLSDRNPPEEPDSCSSALAPYFSPCS
jgi:outer membrane protein insertion porin family